MPLHFKELTESQVTDTQIQLHT